MKDLVSKVFRSKRIKIKDRYVEFIKNLSKSEIKKKVFLKLANAKEDEKEEDF